PVPRPERTGRRVTYARDGRSAALRPGREPPGTSSTDSTRRKLTAKMTQSPIRKITPARDVFGVMKLPGSYEVALARAQAVSARPRADHLDRSLSRFRTSSAAARISALPLIRRATGWSTASRPDQRRLARPAAASQACRRHGWPLTQASL